ncbi:hypothetical protein AMAG_15233 [Allomyces macrogynus ATCC 38327]|uniref:Ubiquitin carboxyl-terminal hydrolase n=1 Tax=Allomyces macrogynus (strain ATCC 38327) TaxID=578462 RepID=A0A0L0T8F2_ALLM3|nr:hypothetical protein AMAG_15233 [Allomyces macrogynus ATCC 38327]|eukprot:KNE70971.1 hypothetical protein AMAG_15233 [Allomyces macrogynus ATCC 38327]
MFKWLGTNSNNAGKPAHAGAPMHPADIEGNERYYGLQNFGNTCYCNSVLQALYFCRPFRESILHFPALQSIAELLPSTFTSAGESGADPDSGSTSDTDESGGSKSPVVGSSSPNLLRRRTGSNNNVATAKNGKPVIQLPKGLRANAAITVTGNPDDTLLLHLKELYYQIAAQKKRTGVVGPKGFSDKVKKENILFRSTQQQDAHEFLNYMLNAIAELILAERKKNETDDEAAPSTLPAGKTWIHELFEGELATEIRCLTCESTTETRECFLDLSIDVEANSSIASCLWSYSQSEMLCHKDKFYCDTCAGLQEAERMMKIKKLPPVLALHLKRFKYMENQQKYVKLMHRVMFPTELRLFNPSNDTIDSTDQMYDLFAIVVHIGSSPNHGHYVALVRSYDRWLLFDDESVELVSEAHLAKYFGEPDADPPGSTAAGYLLFYQARDMLTAVRKRTMTVPLS